MRKDCLLLMMLLMIAVVVLPMCGCAKKPVEPIAPPPGPPPNATPSTPPAATTSAPGAFAWTEAPKVADLPDAPVKGMINGKAFEAQTVRVKKSDKGAVLVISDMKADTPTGMLSGDTGVELTFPLAAGKPGEYVIDIKGKKDFDKEHAYYWYPQGGDKGPMSVNPDWAAALSITEWTLAKDPKDTAVLGKVKGKFAITFGDDSKSWVAGAIDGVYYE
jgi:hypothetical protein